ncbi:tryptophan synthase beta subunit-like PLP-dependent enzyme [Annulohypoxylon maeteangense]|uniref:tryptophan synthase beta subunit-like PLP-dependent enzyme n=1 Tax=Annulohypoxylon maeteangense TaxID=1927788 RepID=UPI002008A7FF|nr:tryptophan synthase beta subunit-like PLP-dependent enzyme [Annulohypoxylon maeteangense]KAI0886982.1 tryptophan synthase beta subunit-like PLP-dependent enzyme [Annulohypoxylon maeteangense]
MSSFIYLNSPARDRLYKSEGVQSGTRESVVLTFHKTIPEYNETKLHSLPDVAKELGLRHVLLKDESNRFGLPAFKILGASWAVYRAVGSHLGLPVLDAGISFEEVGVKAREAGVQIVTVTEGNCGRAVSRMAAKHMGIPTKVFVPSFMDEKTRAKIRSEGVEVVAIDKSYDDVIPVALEEVKARENTILILDVSVEGYSTIPQYFVEGYSTMLAESDRQVLELTGGKAASHAIVPVGAGSIGEAVTAHFKNSARWKDSELVKVLGVEPITASCLFNSLKTGKSVSVPTEDTIMCGMNCGTLSTTAWPVLRDGIDAGVVVSDLESHNAVQELNARNIGAGPCGAATLAALRRACTDAKQELGLDDTSIVVLYCTEGQREYPVPL